MVMWPENVSAASANDCTMASVCVHTSTLPAVEPVDPNPGERRKEKRRNLAREAHRAQQQRRIRQPVHQPRRGDARHPRADERDRLPAEKQPEVAMPQRAPRMRCAAQRALRPVRRRRAPASRFGSSRSLKRSPEPLFLDADLASRCYFTRSIVTDSSTTGLCGLSCALRGTLKCRSPHPALPPLRRRWCDCR